MKLTSKRHWLERLLALRSGDLGLGLLFFSYYFLVISAYTSGLVARDSLFLAHYRATQLPYVDIGCALLVGALMAAYIPLTRRAGMCNSLVGSLAIFAGCAAFFGWAAHYHHEWKWLYPALYVWVGVFGALATAQVWTLANCFLTTREAKRLFGLIGGGGILGGIFSGFYANAVSKHYGTESLLMTITFFLAVSPLLVIVIWSKRKKQPTQAQEAEEPLPRQGPRNLLEGFRMVRNSPHLRAIAILIGLSSIVTTAAGWQFKAIAKEYLVEKDALAAFFGAFYGCTGILSLLMQVLLTSRFLRHFGLGVALFALPITLMGGSVGMLVWGTLWAATMLNGSNKVLRYSIDSSAMQLLYLPVPNTIKMQVKTFIDSVMWRLGDGLAGLTLLIFATFLHFTPSQVSWIVLVLLGLWITTAYRARRQYVTTLREGIQQYRMASDPKTDGKAGPSLSSIMQTNLRSADPQEVLSAMNQLETTIQPKTPLLVRGLLDHPSKDVRQKALSILGSAGDKVALPQVQHLLEDENIDVRGKALSFLGHLAPVDPLACVHDLSLFPQSSIRAGIVSFLVNSREPQNVETARLMLDAMVREEGADGQKARLASARLLGSLPDYFEEQLRILLDDPEIEVESAAIKTVGKLRQRRFIPHLLQRLSDPRVQPVVIKALAKFGDGIVGTLSDYLSDHSLDVELRRSIPAVLVRIGTPEAARVLTESLLEGDTVLRLSIISSLNKLRRSRPEVELDASMIETVLAAEIMGHYRSYQILGTLGGQLEGGDIVGVNFRESINQEVERIFRLMQLLFPRHDLHSAYFGLQSNDLVVHDNALEFLDNILKPQVRRLLVPLLDSDVSTADRVRIANRVVGAKVESRDEAVQALMHSQDPWLESRGAYAIGALGIKSLEPELDKHLDDSDALLQEAARQAKARLSTRSS